MLIILVFLYYTHCVKNVRIRSYSDPYIPVFGLITEKYEVSRRIQSECRKIRTRITLNADTLYAVTISILFSFRIPLVLHLLRLLRLSTHYRTLGCGVSFFS